MATDGQGQFTIGQVGREEQFLLQVYDDRFARWFFRIEPIGQRAPREASKRSPEDHTISTETAVYEKSSEPMVGSWLLSKPEQPGVTRLLTVKGDGTLTSRDFSNAGGAILQDTTGTWSVENKVLIVRKSNGPEEHFPIASLTDEEFTSGDLVYRRETVLSPPPAQIVEGRVVYADTKEGVPQARLTIYSNNEEMGSAIGIAGHGDRAGRFRINPFPGKFLKITAYPPGDAPYLTVANRLVWPQGAARQEADLRLPRGVLVRGKIIETSSAKPIAGACIQYLASSKNRDVPKEAVTGWQAKSVSGPNGTFEIAVPRGQGTLLIRGPTPDFVNKTVGSREVDIGEPGGRRYYLHGIVHLDLQPESRVHEVTVSLQRGVTVRGRLIGPDGKPPAEVIMASQVNVRGDYPHWSSFPVVVRDGQFELHGVDPKISVRAYVLDVAHQRGAAAEIAANAAGEGPVTVRLAPCGRATARFIDPQGKPVVTWNTGLHFVMTPGPSAVIFRRKAKPELVADQDFVANFDHQHYWSGPRTDQEGKVVFPALIPGAIYRLNTFDKDRGYESKEFTVKSGEAIQLGDIVLDKNRGLVGN